MEALTTDVCPLLLPNLLSIRLGLLYCLWLEAELDRLGELLRSEILVGNRVGARLSTGDHSTPEGLVAKEWNHGSRLAGFDASRCSTRTAVVDDS